MADLYEDQNKVNQALEYYNRALSIYEKENKDSINYATTLDGIGNVFRAKNKSKQALENYNRALAIK